MLCVGCVLRTNGLEGMAVWYSCKIPRVHLERWFMLSVVHEGASYIIAICIVQCFRFLNMELLALEMFLQQDKWSSYEQGMFVSVISRVRVRVF